MPVAIDTSVLISSEKRGDFGGLLPENEEGPTTSRGWRRLRSEQNISFRFFCFLY
jgi:hypothetical protein